VFCQNFAGDLRQAVCDATENRLPQWFRDNVDSPPRVSYLVAAAVYAKIADRYQAVVYPPVTTLVRKAVEILTRAADATTSDPYWGYDAEVDVFRAEVRRVLASPMFRAATEFLASNRSLLAVLRNSLSAIGALDDAWRPPGEAFRQFVFLAFSDAEARILPQLAGHAAEDVALREITVMAWSAFHPQAPWLVAWDTSSVRALAESMYEKDDFSAAPILADALMEAGCEDAPLLASLQNPPPDTLFRGCWVIDKAAGKR